MVVAEKAVVVPKVVALKAAHLVGGVAQAVGVVGQVVRGIHRAAAVVMHRLAEEVRRNESTLVYS